MAAPAFPGLRFHQPTGNEIIRNYLINKVMGRPKPYDTVPTEDVYSTDPDQLPLEDNIEHFNDNEWYFYTTRTHKNHYLTRNGYYLDSWTTEWIFHNNKVVGFKRILRFFLGEPLREMETNWFVHEFQVNPGIFPAVDQLDRAVQEKLSSLVMCKITHTPEPSVNESEERVRDDCDSSRIDMEELLSKRFQPTDDEIVRSYLSSKILGRPKPYDVITTEDVYSTGPENLPLVNDAGHFNDNEWYFYTTRTNKSHYLTRNGYYLATSTDEKIFHNNEVVGFKRILRFYLGKPPRQMETDWFVNEFRVNPGFFPAANRLGSAVQGKLSSLVVCKIFRTQEPSVNESEERIRDEHDSSRIDIEEPMSTMKNLQIR